MCHHFAKAWKKPRTVTLSDRKLVRMFRNNPRTTEAQVYCELETAETPVSLSTVKHHHGLRRCLPRKKPLLQNLQAQLKFATAHMDKPNTFRRKV